MSDDLWESVLQKFESAFFYLRGTEEYEKYVAAREMTKSITHGTEIPTATEETGRHTKEPPPGPSTSTELVGYSHRDALVKLAAAEDRVRTLCVTSGCTLQDSVNTFEWNIKRLHLVKSKLSLLNGALTYMIKENVARIPHPFPPANEGYSTDARSTKTTLTRGDLQRMLPPLQSKVRQFSKDVMAANKMKVQHEKENRRLNQNLDLIVTNKDMIEMHMQNAEMAEIMKVVTSVQKSISASIPQKGLQKLVTDQETLMYEAEATRDMLTLSIDTTAEPDRFDIDNLLAEYGYGEANYDPSFLVETPSPVAVQGYQSEASVAPRHRVHHGIPSPVPPSVHRASPPYVDAGKTQSENLALWG